MRNNEKRRTLSIPEAADELGISVNLAYTLARRGELPGTIHLGVKRMVVSRAAIERILGDNGDKEVDNG